MRSHVRTPLVALVALGLVVTSWTPLSAGDTLSARTGQGLDARAPAVLRDNDGDAGAHDAPPDPIRRAVGRAAISRSAVCQAERRAHGVAWGAAVGGGTAMVVTALAANAYGQNETGRFCGSCFWVWSLVSVPVGVGLGALVGRGVDVANHSARERVRAPAPAITPFVTPRGGGIVGVMVF